MEFVQTRVPIQQKHWDLPKGKVGHVLCLRKLPSDPETMVLVKWWRGSTHPVPLSLLDELTTQQYYERR